MRARLSYYTSYRSVESQLYYAARMITKLLVVLCCLAAVVLASNKYTDKYDNIDIDEILSNDILLEKYVLCILDEGKCTAEGKELKNNLQDSLETGCDKCTEIQVQKSTKVMNYLINHKIEYWNRLCAKYDPNGVWRKKYEGEAKERGIIIPKS